MVIIAFDPGKGGGIAIYNKGYSCVPMPFFDEIVEIILDLKKQGDVLAIYEKVFIMNSDMEGGKVFHTSKLVEQRATLQAAFQLTNIPTVEVASITWQSGLGLRIKNEPKPERKKRYKTVAQAMFPDLKVTMKTCDALLILAFGMKKLKQEKGWITDRVKIFEKKVKKTQKTLDKR